MSITQLGFDAQLACSSNPAHAEATFAADHELVGDCVAWWLRQRV
jgi:hypothetical protein